MTTLDQAALGRVASRVAGWDGDLQSLNEMAFRRQTLTDIYEDLLFLHHTVKLSRPDAQIRRAKFYQGAVCTAGPTRHPDVPEYCIKFSSSRNCVACALFRRRNPESYPDHVPSNSANTNTAFTSLANIASTTTTTTTTTTEQTDNSKQPKPQAKRRRFGVGGVGQSSMETESDSDGERKTARVKPARRPPRDRSGSTPTHDYQQQADSVMSDIDAPPQSQSHSLHPYRISSHQYYDDAVSDPCWSAAESESESEWGPHPHPRLDMSHEMRHDPLLSLCEVSKSPALSAKMGDDKRPSPHSTLITTPTPTPTPIATCNNNLSLPTRSPSAHGLGMGMGTGMGMTIGHMSPRPHSLILPPPFKLHRSMSASGSGPGSASNSAPGSGSSSGATTARSGHYSADDAEMEPALADVPPAQPGLLSPTLLGIPSRTSAIRARSRSDATPEMLPTSGPWALPPTPPTQALAPPLGGLGLGIPLTRARSHTQQPYDTYAVQLRNGLTMLIGVDARGGLHDPVIPSLAYSRAMSQDSGAVVAAAAASGNSHHPPHLTLPTTGSASPSLSPSPSAPLQSPTEAWFQAIAKQNDAISQSVGTAGPIPVEAALTDHILLSPALTGQASTAISPLQKALGAASAAPPVSPLPLRLNTGMGMGMGMGVGMDVDQIAVQLSKRVGPGAGLGTGFAAASGLAPGPGSNPATPVLGPLATLPQQAIDDHHTHSHFSQVKFSPSRLLPAH